MALISQSDLEARIGRSLTTAEASAFTVINDANQAYVEKVVVGSKVEADDPSSRYYDGGVQHLTISPCTDLTAVAYVDDDYDNDSVFDTSDYTVEPVNDTIKTMVRSRAGKLRTGINNVKVTAKFSTYGDTNTTSVIKDALLSAVESELSNSDNMTKEAIEGYSVEYASTQTKDALNKLKGLFPNII